MGAIVCVVSSGAAAAAARAGRDGPDLARICDLHRGRTRRTDCMRRPSHALTAASSAGTCNGPRERRRAQRPRLGMISPVFWYRSTFSRGSTNQLAAMSRAARGSQWKGFLTCFGACDTQTWCVGGVCRVCGKGGRRKSGHSSRAFVVRRCRPWKSRGDRLVPPRARRGVRRKKRAAKHPPAAKFGLSSLVSKFQTAKS